MGTHYKNREFLQNLIISRLFKNNGLLQPGLLDHYNLTLNPKSIRLANPNPELQPLKWALALTHLTQTLAQSLTPHPNKRVFVVDRS